MNAVKRICKKQIMKREFGNRIVYNGQFRIVLLSENVIRSLS